MHDSEIFLFEQHPFYKDIIKVRLWDEKAKQQDAVLLPLTYFSTLITEHLKDRR